MLDKSPDPRFARSRLALVAAMTALLDERDFADVTITQVVGRASVTRPTFYQHFGDLPSIARHASLARLETAFPSDPYQDHGQSDQERAAEVEQTVLGLLKHLHDHADFYRRAIKGATAVEFYDDLVKLLETRILDSSPLGAKIRQSTQLSAEDRGAVLAGGLTWMIIRWLHSDFTGLNSIPVMAHRVSAAMLVFA